MPEDTHSSSPSQLYIGAAHRSEAALPLHMHPVPGAICSSFQSCLKAAETPGGETKGPTLDQPYPHPCPGPWRWLVCSDMAGLLWTSIQALVHLA